MTVADPSFQPPDLDKLFRESAGDLARYFFRRHGSDEVARELVVLPLAGGQESSITTGTNLVADPGETTNVIDDPAHADALGRASEQLQQRIAAARKPPE